MEGPPLGPGGEDITWPDQVAPRGRKASSTRKIKPQTSNLNTVISMCPIQWVRNFVSLRADPDSAPPYSVKLPPIGGNLLWSGVCSDI